MLAVNSKRTYIFVFSKETAAENTVIKLLICLHCFSALRIVLVATLFCAGFYKLGVSEHLTLRLIYLHILSLVFYFSRGSVGAKLPLRCSDVDGLQLTHSGLPFGISCCVSDILKHFWHEKLKEEEENVDFSSACDSQSPWKCPYFSAVYFSAFEMYVFYICECFSLYA